MIVYWKIKNAKEEKIAKEMHYAVKEIKKLVSVGEETGGLYPVNRHQNKKDKKEQ